MLHLSPISISLNTYVLCCLVTQSCPTHCNLMDCSPLDSSIHGDSPGKNTGVGCHVILQGIFITQRSNTGLPHCGQILYRLSHQRNSNSYKYLGIFLSLSLSFFFFWDSVSLKKIFNLRIIALQYCIGFCHTTM